MVILIFFRTTQKIAAHESRNDESTHRTERFEHRSQSRFVLVWLRTLAWPDP
jgi:hypothetical protein